MAFGDVRKCPVCPAHWIEDNQMYINPDVCPQCGVDVGDYMNEYAKGKGGGSVVLELGDGDIFELGDGDFLELD